MEMKNIAYSVANITEVKRLSLRRPPKSSDGLSDAQAAPTMEGKQDKTSLLLRVVKSVDGQVSLHVYLFSRVRYVRHARHFLVFGQMRAPFGASVLGIQILLSCPSLAAP